MLQFFSKVNSEMFFDKSDKKEIVEDLFTIYIGITEQTNLNFQAFL